MKRTYFFREDLTKGSPDDVVIIPNVPMFVGSKIVRKGLQNKLFMFQAMLNKMRNTGPEILASSNIFLETVDPPQRPFETRTVSVDFFYRSSFTF